MSKNPFEDIMKALRRTQIVDSFMPIIDYVKGLEEDNERYRKQLNEYDKEKEIAKRDKEIKSLRAELAQGFGITDEEWEAIHKWQDNHIKKAHSGNTYAGAIGGRWTFEFIPTSIGDIGTVKCECGAEFIFRELK